MLVETRGRAPLLALAMAASVVALTATAPTAEAVVVIDDFTNEQEAIDDDSGGVPVSTSGTASPNGFARRLIADRTDGSPSTADLTNRIGPNVPGGPGLWSYNADSGIKGRIFAAYQTSDLDLSAFPSLTTDIVSADSQGGTYTLIAVLIDMDGGSFEVGQTFTSVNVGDTLVFALADFKDGGVDTGAIEEIGFSLSASGVGGDAALGQIAAVPLPGALPLFLGGLAGVGYVVRRRQRQAAAA